MLRERIFMPVYMRKVKEASGSGLVLTRNTNQYKQKVKRLRTLKTVFVNFPWTKIFLSVTLLATIGGALFATKMQAGIDKSIAIAKEDARPADIKITLITTPDCSDCFNLDKAVTAFKTLNVSVGSEKTVTADSEEGQRLIKQFGIKRLPSYLATGEITKKTIEGFIKENGEIKDNTFVFTNITPVFVDSETKKEMGRVTATILTDSNCTQCVDPKLIVDAYKKAGVTITDEIEIPWNSAKGQELINQYKVTKIPTFLFSSDAELYGAITMNWKGIGTIENDKSFVFRNLYLPYRDIEKGEIVGLVDLIYLTDATCSTCYDARKVHNLILTQRFNLGVASERTIDINSPEGKRLTNQYTITKVPTVLVSPNASLYPGLKNVWPSVGTVEGDGRYVFREMTQLGKVIYKDLTKNEVVDVSNQTSQ